MGGILFSLEEGEQEVWDGWMDGFLEVVIPTHSDLRRRRQHTHRYYYIHFATHHTDTDTQFIVSCRIAKDDIVLFLMVTISFTRKMGGCCGC